MKKNSVVKKDTLQKNFKKYSTYYWMALPGTIYFIMFFFIPLFGCVIAFQDYNIIRGIWGSEWVGLKHFRDLFNSYSFKRVFTNTVVLGFYKLFLIFPVPVILSLLLNEVRSLRVKKAIQTAIYIPHFLSWTIVGSLVFDFLGANGIFNRIRGVLGLPVVLLMQKEKMFPVVYMISSIWKESGWGTVVYLAAISGIDPNLYEAAEIDGATKIKKMRYITLPLLLPTVITMFLLNMGSFLEQGFDQINNLLTPMTYATGDVFATYVYRVGIQQLQYSETTAVGLFQSVVALVLVVIFNRISKKVADGEGGLW